MVHVLPSELGKLWALLPRIFLIWVNVSRAEHTKVGSSVWSSIYNDEAWILGLR